MKLTYLPLALLALVLAASTAQARWLSPDNYPAAKCASQGKRCTWGTAKWSRECRPYVWMSEQPVRCRQAACKYCKKTWRRGRLAECRSAAIQRNCFGAKPRKPQYKPTPVPKHMIPRPPRNNGKCLFRGKNGRVYIPATAFPVKKPWKRVGNHIVWRPTGGPGIDRMGSGKACVAITVDQTGRYFLTARTAAPHVSEHNDMWMGFSQGLDLLRQETRSFRSGTKDGKTMLKGYHPVSFYQETDQLYTIDHNPHQLITKNIYAGREYRVCIAGRSSKFRVFAVILLRCQSIQRCSIWGSSIPNRLKNKTPTKCV